MAVKQCLCSSRESIGVLSRLVGSRETPNIKSHTHKIIKSSCTLHVLVLKNCDVVYLLCVFQPSWEKWDVMCQIRSKRGGRANQYFLKIRPLTESYPWKKKLKFTEWVVKWYCCYNTLQNFTTFEFWSLFLQSNLELLWSPNVVSCYSLCFNCLWMVSSVFEWSQVTLHWSEHRLIHFLVITYLSS